MMRKKEKPTHRKPRSGRVFTKLPRPSTLSQSPPSILHLDTSYTPLPQQVVHLTCAMLTMATLEPSPLEQGTTEGQSSPANFSTQRPPVKRTPSHPTRLCQSRHVPLRQLCLVDTSQLPAVRGSPPTLHSTHYIYPIMLISHIDPPKFGRTNTKHTSPPSPRSPRSFLGHEGEAKEPQQEKETTKKVSAAARGGTRQHAAVRGA